MFINVNLTDVKERRPVPLGKYHLTVAKAEPGEKDGKSSIQVLHEIEGHHDAMPVSHRLSLPSPGDEKDKAEAKKLFMARYLHTFNIPYDGSGFSLESLYGASADVVLTLTEPDENGNTYNRIQLERLPQS